MKLVVGIAVVLVCLVSHVAYSAVDAGVMWKSYRAQYTIVARNQKKVCLEDRLCKVWADRFDTDYVDPQTRAVIPQLLAWKLILSQSGSSSSSRTVSLVMPVFSDRGTSKFENGILIYEFAGRISKIGAGTFDLTLHASVMTKPDGYTLLHVDLAGVGADLHDDYDLIRTKGTNLEEPPLGIVPGVLATYEWGQNGGGRYQAVKCTVSYNPNSPYYILAKADLFIGSEKHSIGGIQFKLDSTNLFKSAMALWSSHGSVKSWPSANDINYFAVYAPSGAQKLEIPVFGIGVKSVTNDAPSAAIYAFRDSVKSLCDQIHGL